MPDERTGRGPATRHTLSKTEPGALDGNHCEERAAVESDPTAGCGIGQARGCSRGGSLRRRRALFRVTTYNLAFIGFGNVGRALAALLASPHSAVSERYGIDYQVTGVAARRLGWWADERGLDPAALGGVRCADLRDWLARARPDVVFETTPLDPHAGQPALDYPRESLAAAALDYGARRSAGAVKGRNGSA
jgi:hypothetical protein